MRDRTLVWLLLAMVGLLAIGIGVAASTPDGSGEQTAPVRPIPDDAATATFAGGCFWCTEAAFDIIPGVYSAVSGYTGGTTADPTYEQVISGATGHFESVRVYYDPEQLSYDDLLSIYWPTIDPTDGGGQLFDRGEQYRTAIFYHDEEQRAQAEASRAALDASGRFDEPVVTEILPVGPFYEAEAFHQDFYLNAADHYQAYVDGSGRYAFLDRIWGEDLADD
jgi:methionine-S-sulfoxide reductase